MRPMLFIAIFIFSQLGFANPCDIKRLEITKELELAKLHKVKDKISGLEKALSEVNSNCTPESLAKEKEEKISKLQAKVEERKEALKKAEADGKSKKIQKAKAKLEESLKDLEDEKSQ